MSLTSLFKYNPDIRERFAHEFIMPEFNTSSKIFAEPNTRNFPLVGTAFDYLLRFHIEKLNPDAVKREWVAEAAGFEIVTTGKKLSMKKYFEYENKVKKILETAKVGYTEYVKTGLINDDFIKSSIGLAKLDGLQRSFTIDYESLDNVEVGDIEDLKNLLKLVKDSDFISNKICLLNPTFGKASTLVGGADMDLVIDTTMIDIKTTKYLNLQRDYLDQLIGYYLLSIIGGIDGAPKGTKIEFLGIYYSRHGLLYKFPVEDVVKNCDMKKMITWFKKRAKQD